MTSNFRKIEVDPDNKSKILLKLLLLFRKFCGISKLPTTSSVEQFNWLCLIFCHKLSAECLVFRAFD